ncbi:MAG: putative metalloprotease CJM1_0395 family protein [Desulfobacter sp.]
MNINTAIFNPYTQTPEFYNKNGMGTDVPSSIPVRVSSEAVQVQAEPQAKTVSENQQGTTASEPTSGDQDARGSEPRETSESIASRLTPEELRLVDQLQQIDQEVRRHEMAHMAAGGSLITSAASFTYQRGPDGQSYAVGGEVSIDTSPVPGDPEATARKMRQVRSAALAPGDPSSQDLKVAANASSEIAKAMAELTMLQAKEQAEQREAQAFGNARQASDTYSLVNRLSEEDKNTFQVAV